MTTVAKEVTRREASIQMEANLQMKPLLTPDEFRDELKNTIGRNSIYELLATGRIKHLKLGRKILIPASEIEAFPSREAEVNK